MQLKTVVQSIAGTKWNLKIYFSSQQFINTHQLSRPRKTKQKKKKKRKKKEERRKIKEKEREKRTKRKEKERKKKKERKRKKKKKKKTSTKTKTKNPTVLWLNKASRPMSSCSPVLPCIVNFDCKRCFV